MTRRSNHGSGQEGIAKDRRSGAAGRARCLESETSGRRRAGGAETELRRDLGGVVDGGCATGCVRGSSLPILGGYRAPSRDAGVAWSGACGPDGSSASGCRLRASFACACAGTPEGIQHLGQLPGGWRERQQQSRDGTRESYRAHVRGVGRQRHRPGNRGARRGDAVGFVGKRAWHLQSHPRGARSAHGPARASADAGLHGRLRRGDGRVACPADVGAARRPGDRATSLRRGDAMRCPPARHRSRAIPPRIDGAQPVHDCRAGKPCDCMRERAGAACHSRNQRALCGGDDACSQVCNHASLPPRSRHGH